MSSNAVQRSVPVIFCAFLLCPSFVSGAPTTLTPNEILTVRFSTPGNPNIDALNFHMGYVTVISPYTLLSGDFYDDTTFLGTNTLDHFGGHTGLLSLNPALNWKSSESLWTFNNPTVIDFTSIRNGLSSGQIDFSIATGEMLFDTDNIRISLLKGTGPNSGEVYGEATIHSTSVQPATMIPAPGALILGGIGMGLVGVLRRRRTL